MSTAQAVRSKSAGKAKRRGKPSRREEPPPVASGRFVTAFFIVAALALIPATLKNLFTPEDDTPVTDTSKWQIGKTDTVHVTLVTADYERLACASKQTFEGKYCEYEDDKKRRPVDPSAPLDDNKANVIQPYRTWPDNKLILISGLWAEPALATRLHIEPSRGIAADKLARFTAQCKVRFYGRMDKSHLRWQPGQKWIDEGAAMIGEAKDCTVLPPDIPGVP